MCAKLKESEQEFHPDWTNPDLNMMDEATNSRPSFMSRLANKSERSRELMSRSYSKTMRQNLDRLGFASMALILVGVALYFVYTFAGPWFVDMSKALAAYVMTIVQKVAAMF